MLRSMTGFARAERTTAAGLLAWEIRSVNHRYLEVGLPPAGGIAGLRSRLPPRHRRRCAPRQGGRVVLCPLGSGGGRELTLDEDLLDRLIENASAVRRRLGAESRVDAVDLLRWPGVVKEAERDTAPLAAAATDLLAEALAAFTTSRASEGERIAQMLASRAAQLLGILDEIAARLPEIQSRIRAKLQERIAALVAEVNPERLEQEVAILVQKR